MTNPAKGIFEKYAETGFYSNPDTTEPTITITVMDAKGLPNGDAGTIVFTYNRTTGMWSSASRDEEKPIPNYVNGGGGGESEIAINNKVSQNPANLGQWKIEVTNPPADVSLEPNTGEDDIDVYLNRVCTDVYLTWGKGKATGRTVYMDSNIALTDGEAPVGSGKAKTIPNLYKAIHDMDTRIDAINVSHGPSTADAGLYVKHISSAADPYQAFSKGASDGIEISVGDGFGINGNIARNAKDPKDLAAYNMHFRANEITFTVTNQNHTVEEAYPITDNTLLSPTASPVKCDGVQDVCLMILGAAAVESTDNVVIQLKNSMGTTTYYWVPMEGHTGVEYINGGNVLANAHGKILMKVTNPSTQTLLGLSTSQTVVLTTATGDEVTVGAVARALLGIHGKGGTVVYTSHAVVKAGKTLTVGGVLEEDKLKVSSEMTYNLGAIIEAIQELNRRTMFMDTDMSFNGAMSYGDYQVDKENDTIHYGKVLDGLPAATDSNLGQHYGV